MHDIDPRVLCDNIVYLREKFKAEGMEGHPFYMRVMVMLVEACNKAKNHYSETTGNFWELKAKDIKDEARTVLRAHQGCFSKHPWLLEESENTKVDSDHPKEDKVDSRRTNKKELLAVREQEADKLMDTQTEYFRPCKILKGKLPGLEFP